MVSINRTGTTVEAIIDTKEKGPEMTWMVKRKMIEESALREMRICEESLINSNVCLLQAELRFGIHSSYLKYLII